MRLAISSIVFVAAFALVGCEKKVEAPAVADAGVPEKPACCEPAPAAPAVDADAAAPVAPLTAPVVPAAAPAAAPTSVTTAAPAPAVAPVAAPTTTIKK